MSVGLMVPTWQRGFSPGTPVSSAIKNHEKDIKIIKNYEM